MSGSMIQIQVNKRGRNFLAKNKQEIVLIRPFNTDEAVYQIVAATFTPFSRNTKVTLTDNWQIVASNTPIKPNNILEWQYPTSAQLGQSYDFQPSGFKANGSTTAPNMVSIGNNRENPSSISFGFEQEMDLDDGKGTSMHCIAMQSIPYNYTGAFSPTDTLWVLAASGLKENMLINTASLNPSINSKKAFTSILGKYLSIQTKRKSIIHFNSTTHTFQLGALPKP